MKKLLLPAVFLSLGVALIALGSLGGGSDSVWGKAVMICLECIGIG